MATLSGMVVDNKAPVYSYDWLCQKMQDRGRVAIRSRVDSNVTYYGTINGIKAEDGSGNNWLVTICENLNNNTIYVKTA